ncbi:hypothetical protein [Winogradskyella undariae]|uniref:hypothetical protein n=1 Tax=Winogradskyella undariae TaxID=1285465 RepID=UPI0015C867E9|nr:hypothetical protein [Winogradskyella undariae]
MKILNKKIGFLVVATLFSAIQGQSQTAPNPPTPPTTMSVSTNISRSISVEENNDVQHSSSISVSNSDDTYKFRARYDNSKNEGIKALVLKQLGKDNLLISGKTYLWTIEKDNNKTFECKLNKGNIKIFVNKNKVSHSFQNKIIELGKDLKNYISGTDTDKEEAKQNLEKAKRELEKAQQELERAEQAAKRETEN